VLARVGLFGHLRVTVWLQSKVTFFPPLLTLTHTTGSYILLSSMIREFIETTAFTKRVEKAGHGLLIDIQNQLMEDPEAGDLIQGTGGLRKIRIADPGRGKGKRGGYRVIYLDLSRVEQTYLLSLYNKGEKDNISNEEKKELHAWATKLKEEAK
jgi:hypothetical protein